LRNDDDAGGVGRLQIIAGVDQPQAHPSGDRRDDVGIGEIELGRLDLRLVGDDRRLVLGDQRLLVVDLLLGDRILLVELFVAGEVALRLAEQRLVLGQLPLGLRQRRLVGARIDLGEEVAGLDGLALGEPDFLQGAGDLGLDGHGLERRHRSQGVDGQRHVAQRHGAHAHRLRRLPGTAGVLPFVGRGGDVFKLLPGEDGRGRQRHNERDPDDEAAPARPRRFPDRRRRVAHGVGLEGFVHP